MTSSRSVPPPVISVSVQEAKRDFDALLEAVTTKGTHVTITRDQVPVAVIVPWAWYRTTEERMARYDVAYWSSWSDAGDFDDDAYARKVADLEKPAPLPTDDDPPAPDPDPPSEPSPQTDAGGDDDV